MPGQPSLVARLFWIAVVGGGLSLDPGFRVDGRAAARRFRRRDAALGLRGVPRSEVPPQRITPGTEASRVARVRRAPRSRRRPDHGRCPAASEAA
ncbi:hypothetical protein [Methylobacterium sp. WL116]|uniref:hypothetical protein n=1 Tax=Methylobacterium sp. WL116 TaxID=2603889 RepID=UPI0011C895AA|nr:hypothetical protein [Methylobacterium sp. WL116]TXM81992.1 hypothetical protein FV223_29315 [Methylobacterium sp. WL116]